MEDMKKRLTDAIKGCNELCRECDRKSCEGCFLLAEYEKEASALIELGVLMPPVKLGDPVYAVVELEDEPEVCEYVVNGIAYSLGKWLFCENDNEFNELGTQPCLLTREEAEVALETIRRAREEKHGM